MVERMADRIERLEVLSGHDARAMREFELARTALEDVDDAMTFEPFSRDIDNLFHSTTPCCSHFGRAS